MSYKNLIYETEDKVGSIEINRREVRNVLNWGTWMELENALKQLKPKKLRESGLSIVLSPARN
jgi:enoyl-CoA hydratase/carnithine racemase